MTAYLVAAEPSRSWTLFSRRAFKVTSTRNCVWWPPSGALRALPFGICICVTKTTTVDISTQPARATGRARQCRGWLAVVATRHAPLGRLSRRENETSAAVLRWPARASLQGRASLAFRACTGAGRQHTWRAARAVRQARHSPAERGAGSGLLAPSAPVDSQRAET